MAGIDDVLERLVTDPGFRQQLRDDPQGALDGYELGEDDLELLASQLDDSGGAAHGVEQRTSKSALFGLLGAVTGSATADAGQQETDWNFISSRAEPAQSGYGKVEMQDIRTGSVGDQGVGELAAEKPVEVPAEGSVELGSLKAGSSEPHSEPPADPRLVSDPGTAEPESGYLNVTMQDAVISSLRPEAADDVIIGKITPKGALVEEPPAAQSADETSGADIKPWTVTHADND